MNIIQFNTVDSGGAFQAANRLQNGLIQSSISSKMLVLYKKKEQYQPNIISYLENQSIFTEFTESSLCGEILKVSHTLRVDLHLLGLGRQAVSKYVTGALCGCLC